MAGHGGARPGAGAPKGGISQARRLLMRGLQRGLAHAGRAKGLIGDEEEVATQSVAMIASDMVLAGQGRDVLAIWAQAAPKGDEGDEGGKKSVLLAALESLPGLGSVQNPSQLPRKPAENAAESKKNEPLPTYPAFVTRSDQPFFSPQGNLLPPSVLPPPHPASDDASPSIVPATSSARAGVARTQEEGAGTPYPPSARPPGILHPDTENLEKISEENA